MNITIGIWIIPALISLVIAGLMFRPYQSSGMYDFGAVFRLFWLIPLAIVWAVYFAIIAYLK